VLIAVVAAVVVAVAVAVVFAARGGDGGDTVAAPDSTPVTETSTASTEPSDATTPQSSPGQLTIPPPGEVDVPTLPEITFPTFPSFPTVPDISVPTPESLAPVGSIPPAAQPPDGLGDDPELDALARSCHDGDMQACDDLYDDSDAGSEYETYGDTCAGRQDRGTRQYCRDSFPS